MKVNRKILWIAGFYVISFIVTLFLAGHIFNYDRIHPSKNQGDTSLIKLYVKTSGMLINEMDGYRQAMDAAYLRDSITPVSENKELTLQVREPVNSVRNIRYTLMDENNAVEIESGECPEVQRVEGNRETRITFAADLQDGKEYCLNLTVEDDKKQTCYYYTRIVTGNDLMAYDKLQFAMDFHKATFEKTAASRIAEYLSSASDGISNDFRKVTIASDSETITWGDLAPEVVGEVKTTVTNLDNRVGEIQMIYEIVARDDSGNDYNYMVEEHYSVSSDGSKEDLLDYSRTMEEKVNERSFVFDNNRLRLGMVDEDGLDIRVYGREEPEETETESGAESEDSPAEKEEYNTYISFEADGGLWVYNTRDNILTQAFGFEKKSQGSQRDASYRKHGVKVLRTEDNGDLYFAVYGYMYNGDNEGNFGIEINRYNRADGTYSEMLFIPYHKNYNMLNRGIQEMAFIDDNDMLYLCLEDTLYRFDIVMKTSEIVMEQIGSESCSISEDGQSMATVQADESGRTHEILWTNLATGESRTFDSGKERIEMVGMLGENLVYGIGRSADKDGRMETLYITDFERQVLKEYHVEGGYISRASINGNLIEISRKNSSGGDMAMDYILYNQPGAQEVEVADRQQEFRKNESWMTISQYGNKAPVVLQARAIEAYRNTWMDFRVQDQNYTGYMVFQADNILKYPTFKEAYLEALENGGSVLDSQGKVIIRPSSRAAQKDLNGASIGLAGEDAVAQQNAVLQWLMAYEGISGSPEIQSGDMLENMKKNLPDVHVVDMSGIALEDALSMVSEGVPLVVKNSEGTWCVVEGYTDSTITVADPKDSTAVRYEWDSVVKGIASSGNVIYSYYK